MNDLNELLDNLRTSLSKCTQSELEELRPVFKHCHDVFLNKLKGILKPWLAERWKKNNPQISEEDFDIWFNTLPEEEIDIYYAQMEENNEKTTDD